MPKIILGLVIGLVGIVIGVNIADTNQSDIQLTQVPTTNNSLNESKLVDDIKALQLQIRDLTNLVTSEKSQRETLQTELAKLKKEFTSVSVAQKISAPEAAPTANEPGNDSITDLSGASTASADISSSFNTQQAQTTSTILASIGVDPVIAETIEEQSEKQEMEQLYLRNKAIREGWFGTEKYFQESRQLEQESNVIREELGESKYDEYLYASGQFNRIKVSSILAQSPAEQAGLKSDDIILSYDNSRVYSWSDLTTQTAAGNPGDTVEVNVLRNGVVSKVYIPRGPMGIRLESMRVDPNENS